MNLAPGARSGQYETAAQLGAGGMGYFSASGVIAAAYGQAGLDVAAGERPAP